MKVEPMDDCVNIIGDGNGVDFNGPASPNEDEEKQIVGQG